MSRTIIDIDFEKLAKETNQAKAQDKFNRYHENDLPEPQGNEIAKGVFDMGEYIFVGDKD